MKVKASTVEEYLLGLPEDRRDVIKTLRALIRKHLPKGYQESLTYGVITYEVPLAKLAETYNGQPLAYVSLAAQKNHYALYLMCVYGDVKLKKKLEDAFAKAGKKLDMGKSCVRFKKLEDLPLDVIGEIVASVPMEKYIESYKKLRGERR